MTVGTAVKCTVCGAATGVQVDAVKQTCEFCGAAFIYQPTRAAAGVVEQRLRACIEAIQHELDALDADAVRLAGAGDLAGAHQKAGESVRRVGVLYEETGYNRLLGFDTPELAERNVGFLFQLHLQRLGIPGSSPPPSGTPPVDTSGHDRMMAGLQARDFDTAIAGYAAMCIAQTSTDPQWADRDPDERRQMLATSVRSFALGLPWATADDYARHGIELPQVTSRSDGSAAVACAKCNAEVVLARLAESVQCPHCSATFRVHLAGLDAYHASGHTDVTQADVDDQQLVEAMARGDLGARMKYARKLIAGQAPAGSDRMRELTFVYTLQIGAALPAAQQARIAGELRLGTPRTCRSCSATIALAAASSTCPMCTASAG